MQLAQIKSQQQQDFLMGKNTFPGFNGKLIIDHGL